MNPVFWFLVLLGAVFLWFLCSFVFYPLGLYIWRIWSDTIENMEKDNKENDK